MDYQDAKRVLLKESRCNICYGVAYAVFMLEDFDNDGSSSMDYQPLCIKCNSRDFNGVMVWP